MNTAALCSSKDPRQQGTRAFRGAHDTKVGEQGPHTRRGKHGRAAALAQGMCYQCEMPMHHSNSPFCQMEICTADSTSFHTRGRQRPCSPTSTCSKWAGTQLEDDWVLTHQNLHSLCLPIASHTDIFLKYVFGKQLKIVRSSAQSRTI